MASPDLHYKIQTNPNFASSWLQFSTNDDTTTMDVPERFDTIEETQPSPLSSFTAAVISTDGLFVAAAMVSLYFNPIVFLVGTALGVGLELSKKSESFNSIAYGIANNINQIKLTTAFVSIIFNGMARTFPAYQIPLSIFGNVYIYSTGVTFGALMANKTLPFLLNAIQGK
ncbi:MAG: hypothetical protein WC222_02695 [Parachlamydiales bacterium]|jgi:hypothetical protein